MVVDTYKKDMKHKCNKKEQKKDLEKTVGFLKIIAEENRLKILCLLQKKEMCVCDIWQHFNLSQNLVSHHLKVLKNFDLLTSKKEGTKVIYSINPQTVASHCSLLSHYLNNKN